MFQTDLILNETRKLAALVAKLMGLKISCTHEEFTQQFNKALQDEYDTELEQLLALNESDFTNNLNTSGYSLEKLNALGQLLYMFAFPVKPGNETNLLLNKVLIIFDLLEQKHHYQSFENIDKRNTIYSYFKQNGQS